MKKEKYNFNEKEYEYDIKTGEDLEVWQSPQYRNSKAKVIEILDSEKYDLNEGDFWILMNKTKKGKMAYTGLIISHNGCLKINDKLENKVNPHAFSIDKEGYKNSLVVSYVDDEVCEFGEFNTDNCHNAYPYAMAYKRCFDRVVLKKSKLAYAGVYSDSEADEIKENQDKEIDNEINEAKKHMELEAQLDKLITDKNVDYIKLCNLYKIKEQDIHKMTNKQLENAIQNIDKFEKVV